MKFFLLKMKNRERLGRGSNGASPADIIVCSGNECCVPVPVLSLHRCVRFGPCLTCSHCAGAGLSTMWTCGLATSQGSLWLRLPDTCPDLCRGYGLCPSIQLRQARNVLSFLSAFTWVWWTLLSLRSLSGESLPNLLSWRPVSAGWEPTGKQLMLQIPQIVPGCG